MVDITYYSSLSNLIEFYWKCRKTWDDEPNVFFSFWEREHDDKQWDLGVPNFHTIPGPQVWWRFFEVDFSHRFQVS